MGAAHALTSFLVCLALCRKFSPTFSVQPFTHMSRHRVGLGSDEKYIPLQLQAFLVGLLKEALDRAKITSGMTFGGRHRVQTRCAFPSAVPSASHHSLHTRSALRAIYSSLLR